MIKKYQYVLWILLILALIALTTSFFIEYIIKIHPCILCKLQRIPYFASGMLALLGLCISFKKKIIRLIQVCFLAGMILAAYHSSIQWEFLGSPCQKNKIEKTGSSWKPLGIPLPFYNGIFSFVVLVGTEIFLIWAKKKESRNK